MLCDTEILRSLTSVFPLFIVEINAFRKEQGQDYCNEVVQHLRSKEDLVRVLEENIHSTNHSLKTIIVWGHGNRLDDTLGYLKIFEDDGKVQVFFINDLMTILGNEAKRNTEVITQLLLTQCWGHCHDHNMHEKISNLRVDWLASPKIPETSARRWDLYNTGSYMTQKEFSDYLMDYKSFICLKRLTERKYCGLEQTVLLKYLSRASIHIEASMYIHRMKNKCYEA